MKVALDTNVLAYAEGVNGAERRGTALDLVHGLPQEATDALAAAIPYPARLGEPGEFAQLVLAMIENDYLNGEIVRLDGALRMPPK